MSMSLGASSLGNGEALTRLASGNAAPVLVFEVDTGPSDDAENAVRHWDVRLVGSLRDRRRVNGNGQLPTEGDLSAVLVLRALTPSRLLSCVRTLTAGRATLPPEAVRLIDPEVAAGHMRVGNRVLTRREFDVLRLLAEGDTTREIAQRMSYSERTVKNIVHDLLEKLGCRTRAHAVALAVRQGVI